MNTMNENILKDQLAPEVREYYKNHSTEQLLTQIKKYEAAAATAEAKAAKNWAKAVNGGEGYQYNVAKVNYSKTAANTTKAEILKDMVQERGSNTKAHNFTGSSATSSTILNAGTCAGVTAGINAGREIVKGVLNGDCAEEVAANATVSALSSGASSAAAYCAGSFAAKQATKAITKSVVGKSAVAAVVPGAVGVGVAIVGGEIACRIAKPVAEELIDGVLYGDPLLGAELALDRASEEIVDMVEEAVDLIEETAINIVCGIQDFFLRFF